MDLKPELQNAKAGIDKANSWLDALGLPTHRLFWTVVILAAAVIGLCFALKADAADLSLSWTLPTTNTDGTAIPATGDGAITSSVVEWGSCSGTAFGTVAGSATVTGTSYTVPNLAPGTYCAHVAAVNSYGNQSAFSNPVQATYTAPTPNPPTLVTVDKFAWSMSVNYQKLALVRSSAVGTVPLGTACDPDRELVAEPGYYAVPTTAVTWTTSGGHPAYVVVKCAAQSG